MGTFCRDAATARAFSWALAALATLLVAGAAHPAAAATITVDTFAQFDATRCTLSSAISAANTDTNVGGCTRVGAAGADTIVLPTGVYALTAPDHGANVDLTGLPDVTSEITIQGNGSAIARTNGLVGPFFRIFSVSAGSLRLVELTVRGGRIQGPEAVQSVYGGGINVTATGSLLLETVTVSDNHLGPDIGHGEGGGISMRGLGILSISDSTVTDNSVTATLSPEPTALGGGIASSVLSIAITRSRLTHNLATSPQQPLIADTVVTGFAGGGAVAVPFGGLLMTSVIVANNTASVSGVFKGNAQGGAVYAGESAPGTVSLMVTDATFNGNAALANGGATVEEVPSGAAGGAIFYGASNEVTIRRSSFVQNTALASGVSIERSNPEVPTWCETVAAPCTADGSFARGGALHYVGVGSLGIGETTFVSNNTAATQGPGGVGGRAQGGAVDFESPGALGLKSVTMTGNFVDAGTGGTPLGAGVAARGVTSLQNSIVIGNGSPADCSPTDPGAVFVSLGFNINPLGGSCGAPVASDKPNANPELTGLVTLDRPAGLYLALQPASAAIDAGNPLTCAALDQLGQTRNGTCDIGAVERVAATSTVAAVLPSTRAGQVGTKLTAFVTVINSGNAPAQRVGLALATQVPALFAYQTTNASNAPTGPANTPATIPPGGSQTFVVSVLPTAPFSPTELVLGFVGTNTSAPSVVGLNTLLVSASTAPIPDLVALIATIGNNGIVDIPSGPNGGVFTLATVNLGAGDLITVSTDTGGGGAVVPISVTICQTNAVGACLQPAASTVTVQIATNATPTFGFFVKASGAIPFDPANTRLFVRLRDSGGAIRGGSSVAPRTVP